MKGVGWLFEREWDDKGKVPHHPLAPKDDDRREEWECIRIIHRRRRCAIRTATTSAHDLRFAVE